MKICIRIVLFFCGSVALTISSCKKEADNPQWDIEVLGPVLQATIGINQLLADSLTSTDANGNVRVVYEGTLDNIASDSVYSIPDTAIQTIYTWPFFPVTINPNTPFYTNNKNLVLNVKGAQLTRAVIRSGIIRLTAKNTLPTRVYFTYTVPEARINGQSLSLARSVAAGSLSSPSYFTEDVDLSGYLLNLTGSTNNLVNTIAYNVIARSDSAGPAFPVVQGDTMVNLTANLIDVTPSYVRGYLGQTIINENGNTAVGIGNIFQSGQLSLDSANLQLTVENSIGADLQTYIESLTSVNSRTNISIPLIATTVLQRNIDLSRASETGNAAAPVRPSTQVINLDNSNSNLTAFLSNLPDQIATDVRLSLNPLGNISGSNDFVYENRLIKTKTRLEIPLRLSMNALTLLDTQELSINNLTNLDPVGPGTFTLVAENGFPIDLRLQLFLLDENQQLTDSLLVSEDIPSGITDVNNNVVGATKTRIAIPVDAERKSRILSAKSMIIRASFSTVNQPQRLYLKENYLLRIKLVADGTYSIR